MSIKNGAIGFILGGAICGGLAWYFTKNKYIDMANEASSDCQRHLKEMKVELEKLKKEYESSIEKTDISSVEQIIDDCEYGTVDTLDDEEEIEDEKRIQEEAEEAADIFEDPINDVKILPPHRIDELQLGETGYDKEYYTIFSDDVFADDYGAKLDPIELLGDELYHNLLGELHELTMEDLIPVVCVRNDEHCTDLVISLDNTLSYEEWMSLDE